MSQPDLGPLGTDPLASRFAAYRGAVRSVAVAAPVAVLDERARRRVRSRRIRLAAAGAVGVLALGALSVSVLGAPRGGTAVRPDGVTSSEPVASASQPSPSHASVSAGPGTDRGAGSGRSTPASAPTCRAAALRARLRTPTVIATDVFVTLEFTNVSTVPCQVQGYPGLTLLGSGSTELPTPVRPDGVAAPVVLVPGAAGAALLRWTKPARPCGEVPQRVRVTAPGVGTGQVIGWVEPGLAAVCDGPIQTSPVQAT